MNIFEKIQLQYLNFSEKEQKVANYILKNSNNIKNMNIALFAKNCNVSTATVTRFCKKLSIQSFSNLKLYIIQSNSQKVSINKDNHLSKVHSFYKNIIDSTNRIVNINHIEILYNKIKNSKKIFIYGLGSSGLTAMELMFRLIRMGFHCQAITDSHLMIMNSSILEENDIVIALSISGETADVVNSVKLAKKNKCFVASITTFPNSSLAINSDFFMVTPNSKLLTNNSLINNQFSFIYIIDVLTNIFLEDEEMQQKMNVTISTILEKQNIID